MANEIFISYRRQDAQQPARELKACLGQTFGADAVFLDEQSIEAGTRFDDELKEAIAHARAMLVVVGPGWFDELDRRHQTGEEDFVRQEVAQALARVAAAEPLYLVPVLMPGTVMRAHGAWPVGLQRDLADFSKHQADAVSLASATAATSDLALLLMVKAGLRMQPGAGQVPMATLAKALEDLLCKQFKMDEVARHWHNPPVPWADTHDLPTCISGFHTALEQLIPSLLELQPMQRENVAASCRRVLALLYQMALDFGVAQFWAKEGQEHPVPGHSAASGVQVMATLQGKLTSFDASDAADTPRLQGVVELNATRPGVGKDRRAAVERLVWDEVLARTPRLGPHPASGAELSAPQRQRLAEARRSIEARGHHVILAEQVNPADRVPTASTQLAAHLEVPYVCYSAQDISAYRFGEGELNYRVLDCLDAIKKLTPA